MQSLGSPQRTSISPSLVPPLSPLLRTARAGLLTLAALLPGISAASATELAFPKDKPTVSLKVPDDWTITYSPVGFELRAPQSESFIVGDVLKKSKKAIDDWNKAASDRLVADGAVFDKNWKPPPPKKAEPVVSASPLGSAQAILPKPSDVPLMAQSAIPHERAPRPSQPAAPATINGMSYRAAQYFGTTYKGKPVDVQVVVMNLNKDEVFVAEQLSAGTDGRAVDIVMSAKPVSPTHQKK